MLLVSRSGISASTGCESFPELLLTASLGGGPPDLGGGRKQNLKFPSVTEFWWFPWTNPIMAEIFSMSSEKPSARSSSEISCVLCSRFLPWSLRNSSSHCEIQHQMKTASKQEKRSRGQSSFTHRKRWFNYLFLPSNSLWWRCQGPWLVGRESSGCVRHRTLHSANQADLKQLCGDSRSGLCLAELSAFHGFELLPSPNETSPDNRRRIHSVLFF